VESIFVADSWREYWPSDGSIIDPRPESEKPNVGCQAHQLPNGCLPKHLLGLSRDPPEELHLPDVIAFMPVEAKQGLP